MVQELIPGKLYRIKDGAYRIYKAPRDDLPVYNFDYLVSALSIKPGIMVIMLLEEFKDSRWPGVTILKVLYGDLIGWYFGLIEDIPPSEEEEKEPDAKTP